MKRALALALVAVLAAPPAGLAATPKKPAAPAAKPPPAQAGRPYPKTRPSGDRAIIRTVADAMGFVRSAGGGETTRTINRVQLRGLGRMTAGGVTYTVPRYVYTISLHLTAAREDIRRRTAAGKSDRLVRVLLDREAWDEREPGVDGLPASDTAANRRLQLARTPFGFTRAMLDAPEGAVKVTDPGPAGKVTVTVPVDGVETRAVLNREYRPETITQVVGGRTLVARYPEYADISEYGLMFPTRWIETVNGAPYLDLTINDGRVASYAVFPRPITVTAQR